MSWTELGLERTEPRVPLLWIECGLRMPEWWRPLAGMNQRVVVEWLSSPSLLLPLVVEAGLLFQAVKPRPLQFDPPFDRIQIQTTTATNWIGNILLNRWLKLETKDSCHMKNWKYFIHLLIKTWNWTTTATNWIGNISFNCWWKLKTWTAATNWIGNISFNCWLKLQTRTTTATKIIGNISFNCWLKLWNSNESNETFHRIVYENWKTWFKTKKNWKPMKEMKMNELIDSKKRCRGRIE